MTFDITWEDRARAADWDYVRGMLPTAKARRILDKLRAEYEAKGDEDSATSEQS